MLYFGLLLLVLLSIKEVTHPNIIPHMPFMGIAKDILLSISSFMDPRHLGNLSMTCSHLNRCITPKLREKSVQDAIKRYTYAVLLPSGAFRFHSEYGVHSMELGIVSGMGALLTDDMRNHPLMSMRYNGQLYVGRVWSWEAHGGFGGFDNTARLFERDSGTMMEAFPGGTWISSVEHNVDVFSNEELYTVVQLACDRGFVASLFPGMYFLELIFTASVV